MERFCRWPALRCRAKAIAAQRVPRLQRTELAKRICMSQEKDNKVLQIRAV